MSESVRIVPDELTFDAFNISSATIFVKNNLNVAISVEIYSYIVSYDSIIIECIPPGELRYFFVKMDPNTADFHIKNFLMDVSTESHFVCKKKLAVHFSTQEYEANKDLSNNEIESEIEKQPEHPCKEYSHHSAKFYCSGCDADYCESCFNTVHTHTVLADHSKIPMADKVLKASRNCRKTSEEEHLKPHRVIDVYMMK